MEPIQVQSLKVACIQRLEELILSGEWRIGLRLPSKRDLAAQLNISRPVLHQALVDLATKGLVTIEPRRGVFINDYRISGSCALLSSLLSFSGGRLDPACIKSMIDMRLLMECETAFLAAQYRTNEHLSDLREILARETNEISDTTALTDLDYHFHLRIAIASGNLVYPLIMNSFRSIYTHLTSRFFDHYARILVVAAVFAFHHQLVKAIANHDAQAARSIMQDTLQHGAEHLRQIP